ncbi:MAG: glycosyltransferase [Candidatus Bathyarchaeota archaeon]|nr:glycosyltransferase [Candidatus Bathyarchaeota archaeon]
MRASVVIPTLQEGKYIGRLLAKIAGVNPRLEIIVVDGGSTDGTVEAAKSFTDKVYVLNRRGIGRARNYGALKANGDVIIFMDADVEPPPGFVDRVLLAFEDKRVVGATCNIMPKGSSPFLSAFFLFYNLLLRLLSHIKPHSRGEFIAVRREAFLKVGGFDERLPCLEDHDLAFRLSKIGRILFLSDLTVYESMRRFKRMGFLRVLRLWVSNYIFLLLFNRTLSKSWEPVR